ncbi:hypothetical protein AQZ52_16875 [Novosphingobium fuchskuhlense]|uniref:Uncharacterized protein n=1 Tax=Novosphingobium fuchskuhlense TaxID=1117702 RepID=A0A117UTD1_9SPHN|nr:hypothetical protein AQZ52_16875 [Novosphingobium fuchskuhlense]
MESPLELESFDRIRLVMLILIRVSETDVNTAPEAARNRASEVVRLGNGLSYNAQVCQDLPMVSALFASMTRLIDRLDQKACSDRMQLFPRAVSTVSTSRVRTRPDGPDDTGVAHC